jgi:hypothetical protein
VLPTTNGRVAYPSPTRLNRRFATVLPAAHTEQPVHGGIPRRNDCTRCVFPRDGIGVRELCRRSKWPHSARCFERGSLGPFEPCTGRGNALRLPTVVTAIRGAAPPCEQHGHAPM